jgi:NhaP-type Na+/H+ and K+/H+ antiporter
VINVTQTVAAARDLRSVLDLVFAREGIGTYTNVAFAEATGWFVIAANVLSLVLAIGFAVPRLRARRTAFWIPLASAAVCVVVTTVLILSAAVADPAFLAKVMEQQQAG